MREVDHFYVFLFFFGFYHNNMHLLFKNTTVLRPCQILRLRSITAEEGEYRMLLPTSIFEYS